MKFYLLGTSNAVRKKGYAYQLELIYDVSCLGVLAIGDVSSSFFVAASDEIKHLHRSVEFDFILIDTFINDVLMYTNGRLCESDLADGYRALSSSIVRSAPGIPVWFLDLTPPPVVGTGNAQWIREMRAAIFSAAGARTGCTVIENDDVFSWFEPPDLLHYRIELSDKLANLIRDDVILFVSREKSQSKVASGNQKHTLMKPPPWSCGVFNNSLVTMASSLLRDEKQYIEMAARGVMGVAFISTNDAADYLVVESNGRSVAIPASTIYGGKMIRYLQLPAWFRREINSAIKIHVSPVSKLNCECTLLGMPNAPATTSSAEADKKGVGIAGVILDGPVSNNRYFEVCSTKSAGNSLFGAQARKSRNVYFDSFWPGFNPSVDPIFGNLLGSLADIKYVTEPEDADLIFCSWASGAEKTITRHKHLKESFGKKMLYYTAEHDGAGLTGIGQIDFDVYDHAISHYRIDDPRHAWMPNYVRRYGVDIFSKVNELYLKNLKNIKTGNVQFCYSNSGCVRRNGAYQAMNSLLPVDCGGRLFNDSGIFLPRDHQSFIEALSRYRFVFAYENSSYPGYCTEKLVHALLAGSVPLYWGDPLAGDIWNRDCFIDLNIAPEEEVFINIAKNPEKIFSAFQERNAIPCPSAEHVENELSRRYIEFFSEILDL